MREHLGILMMIGAFGACGAVEAGVDAPPGSVDAPIGAIDAADGDAPSVDAPGPDASVAIDAPSGPSPVLHWTMDGNVNNSGALTGYSLVTPASVGYGTGKFGQAAAFGAGQYSYVDGMRVSLDTYAKVTIGFWMREPGNVQGSSFLDCNNRATAPYGGVQLGLTGTSVSVCVSTTTSSFLGGSCNGFTAPSANVWHHWIVRYSGAGTSAGQGGPTEIFVDNVLVHTRANDANNNPVFNTTGTPDRLYIGVPNASVDDVRIYNQVFSLADQCTYVVRGTWTGSSCTLP
jgi:hypothetical protein